MLPTDFYSLLLGLTDSWFVSEVSVDVESFDVSLLVEAGGELGCPKCGVSCPVYDHSEERKWRHLDTMQYRTYVVCRVPRVSCHEHGVLQVSVPWASAKSRFTLLFETFMIRYLQMTKSQVRTARLLRVSADQVHGVMHRAVKRGMARRELGAIEHLCIDEKGFQRREFATILCDLVNKCVIEIKEGRKAESAKAAFDSLPRPESVKTVSLDMSEAYRNAVTTHLSQADIIHDRFHVSMMLGKAVDETRRAETKLHPELKESRYVWLKNPENLSESQKKTFKALVGTELKTAEAYAFKQVFKAFFDQETEDDARIFFDHWKAALDVHKLPRLAKTANTLQKNLQGLLNAVKHKKSNAYSESVNSLIQEIKTVARGFRTFEGFRIAILFFLGKLDLNPRKCQ